MDRPPRDTAEPSEMLGRPRPASHCSATSGVPRLWRGREQEGGKRAASFSPRLSNAAGVKPSPGEHGCHIQVLLQVGPAAPPSPVPGPPMAPATLVRHTPAEVPLGQPNATFSTKPSQTASHSLT